MHTLPQGCVRFFLRQRISISAGYRSACTLDFLRPIHPNLSAPLSMTFPSQDVPSSTTNSELLAAPTSSDYPRGSHINTNARANSHSQLSLSSLGLPPSPSASTHSRRHSCLHS